MARSDVPSRAGRKRYSLRGSGDELHIFADGARKSCCGKVRGHKRAAGVTGHEMLELIDRRAADSTVCESCLQRIRKLELLADERVSPIFQFLDHYYSMKSVRKSPGPRKVG